MEPDLCNLCYYSPLVTDLSVKAWLFGYADEMSALIAVRDIQMAQLRVVMVMRRVNVSLIDHVLSLTLCKPGILAKKCIQMSIAYGKVSLSILRADLTK